MSEENFSQENLPKALVALSLSFSAGLVGIVGYVGGPALACSLATAWRITIG
jgi:hypothetical protein